MRNAFNASEVQELGDTYSSHIVQNMKFCSFKKTNTCTMYKKFFFENL